MSLPNIFVSVFLKFIFLLAPFVVVSTFLSLTDSCSDEERKRIAIRSTVAIVIICFTLYLTGKYLFACFGITLDAFRIGAGTILFISGVKMVFDERKHEVVKDSFHDVAVVPLAIPITVGPATIGGILVMGADYDRMAERLVACAALFAATLVVGVVFLLGVRIERVLGARGLAILNKLTGLFLVSLASQLVFTGIYHFKSP